MSLAYKKALLKDKNLSAARFTDVDCSKDVPLTTQADTAEVDINRIMARVAKGQVVLGSDKQPFYGDVSDLGGLQEAIMKKQEAEALFLQYPWDVREKFDNDPVKFVEFLLDQKNSDEAIALGLKKPKPVAPEAPAGPPPATGSPK